MDNIAHIVQCGLCTGCGTCAGICPLEAVVMKKSKGLMFPKILNGKCNCCRLCVDSCPGHEVNFEDLSSGIFEKQTEDRLLGNFLRCYIGHSNDKHIRCNSSSGGIVTELLIFALERRMIDGALVVGMNKNQPLTPQPFVARTKEEVLSASNSKYCPVSINEALKQVMKEDGRFAVVGLPCHIHGIRKAERVSRTLQKRIVLHIGLLCSRTANFIGTEFLLEKMRIRKEHVIELSYRGKEWPGSMSVKLSNGSNFSIPCRGWNAYWPIFSSFFFTPMRCIMCPDHTNELADISLGDAWLPELKHERYGESIIVTRTKTAENLLAFAMAQGSITIKSVKPEKVKQSQAEPLRFKKNDLRLRLAILKSIGYRVPNFSPSPDLSPSFVASLRTFYAYFNIQASTNEHLKSFLINVPFPLFRLYYGTRKILSKI